MLSTASQLNPTLTGLPLCVVQQWHTIYLARGRKLSIMFATNMGLGGDTLIQCVLTDDLTLSHGVSMQTVSFLQTILIYNYIFYEHNLNDVF